MPATGRIGAAQLVEVWTMRALVPLDGSDTALAILPAVRRLAEMAPGIELHLVTVLDPQAVRGRMERPVTEPLGAAAGTATIRIPAPRLIESHGEAIARKSTEWREKLEEIARRELPGTDTQVHVEWSHHTAKAIIELANELDVDVIAMATHGRSGLSHLLAGSVAEEVIRDGGRPVLVVRGK